MPKAELSTCCRCFLLCAAVLPAKPAICFGVPNFLFGVPKLAPRADLVACSDRTKAQSTATAAETQVYCL